ISSLRDVFKETIELDLNMITLIKRIQTKLAIQGNSSKWRSSLHIYSPNLHRDISDNDVLLYDDADLKKRIKPGWQVKAAENGQNGQFVFSRYAVTPYSSYLDPSGSNLIIEVQFDSSNIKDMLDKFKSGGRREPFYYKEDFGVIDNRSADKELTNQVISLLQSEPFQDIESRTVELGEQKYLVNIVK